MEVECEELFAILSKGENWEYQSQYFPSKLGGDPAWLDPVNLPPPEQLQCVKCDGVMTFVLQIYSPTDDDFAFHRMIFVFACQPCMYEFKAFRNQLPRKNDFYSYDPAPQGVLFPVKKSQSLPLVCPACTLPTKEETPLHGRCKIAKEHGTLATKLPEFLLDICQGEIKVPENHLDHEKKLHRLYLEKLPEETDVCESEQKAIETIQKERGGLDRSFQRFCIKTTPNEVIYYCRNGTPLYVSDASPRPENMIPNCQTCGGPRSFEFQILPQLLFHLEAQRIEFGTVTIYTCQQSCNIIGYAEEYVFVETDVSLLSITTPS